MRVGMGEREWIGVVVDEGVGVLDDKGVGIVVDEGVGMDERAQRKPTMLSPTDGSYLSREAARTFLISLIQEPPRNTREALSVGPEGLESGESE